MTALVRQWETSSDSRQVFARRHGLTVACFDYWKRRVRQAAAEEPPVRFAPVHVLPDAAPRVAPTIEVVLVSGERLMIPTDVSSDQVRAVLAALRSSC
jgi:hypothetical protein